MKDALLELIDENKLILFSKGVIIYHYEKIIDFNSDYLILKNYKIYGNDLIIDILDKHQIKVLGNILKIERQNHENS